MSEASDKLERLMADEDFLAWYFQSDPVKGKRWEHRVQHGEFSENEVREAVELLEQLVVEEKQVESTVTAHKEQQLWAAIEQLDEAEQPTPETSTTRLFPKWIRLAASVLLAIGILYLTKLYVQPNTTQFRSNYGEVTQIELPDGTNVTLNGNTTLSYQHPNLFHADREVWIEGEAFFNVASFADKKAFQVHMTNTLITVTGTQFNVLNRSYKEDVLLTEGAVNLQHHNKQQPIQLRPGQQASIKNGTIQIKTGNIAQVTSWKERKFMFDNTSLEEVALSIEALYGITVHFNDQAIAKTTISAILPADNLDVFLQALEATNEFVVKKENKVVSIGRTNSRVL